jgi:hypothetical protein
MHIVLVNVYIECLYEDNVIQWQNALTTENSEHKIHCMKWYTGH